jgi:hypothetical protein
LNCWPSLYKLSFHFFFYYNNLFPTLVVMFSKLILRIFTVLIKDLFHEWQLIVMYELNWLWISFEWCYCLFWNKTRFIKMHWINLYFWQSSKWKFEFTGLNQILEFILYKYLNKNWTIYWSWARGPVLILSEDWHLLLNQNFLHYLASIFIWIINLFYSGIISPLFGALHVWISTTKLFLLIHKLSAVFTLTQLPKAWDK